MKKVLASFIVFATPFIVFAQDTTTTLDAATGLGKVIALISGLINALIPLLIAAALLAFFWGLVQYIFKVGGGKSKGGRSLMIWSLVTLFVMVSVWGLVNLLRDSLGIVGNETVVVPQVPR